MNKHKSLPSFCWCRQTPPLWCHTVAMHLGHSLYPLQYETRRLGSSVFGGSPAFCIQVFLDIMVEVYDWSEIFLFWLFEPTLHPKPYTHPTPLNPKPETLESL